MRRAILPIILTTTALSACGGAQQGSGGDLTTQDVQESRADAGAPPPPAASRAPDAGPDVSPTAAPGVAFTYHYAFRLADERIADVQEQHARTCEQLGINRCRITGMTYRLVSERDIEARLEFKLEPALARRFGRAGLEVVQQADGILIESRINGEDVGTGIAANTRSIEQWREDLRRIEQQIADSRTDEGAKDGLQIEAQRIREQIRAVETSRSEQQQSLATTPMTFEYGSGNYGSDRPDFGGAAANAWDGFLWGLYGLFVTLALLLPWLIGAGLVWLAVRALRRRFPRKAAPAHPHPGDPVF